MKIKKSGLKLSTVVVSLFISSILSNTYGSSKVKEKSEEIIKGDKKEGRKNKRINKRINKRKPLGKKGISPKRSDSKIDKNKVGENKNKNRINFINLFVENLGSIIIGVMIVLFMIALYYEDGRISEVEKLVNKPIEMSDLSGGRDIDSEAQMRRVAAVVKEDTDIVVETPKAEADTEAGAEEKQQQKVLEPAETEVKESEADTIV